MKKRKPTEKQLEKHYILKGFKALYYDPYSNGNIASMYFKTYGVPSDAISRAINTCKLLVSETTGYVWLTANYVLKKDAKVKTLDNSFEKSLGVISPLKHFLYHKEYKRLKNRLERGWGYFEALNHATKDRKYNTITRYYHFLRKWRGLQLCGLTYCEFKKKIRTPWGEHPARKGSELEKEIEEIRNFNIWRAA